MADEVSRRRNAKRGPVVRDDLIAGPYDGMRILFCETELDKIVTQDNPPSGTARQRGDASAEWHYWDDFINATGSFVYRGEVQETRRKSYNLIIWFEYYCWSQAMDAVDQMIADGWTDPNKRRALKSVFVSWGIPAANAQAIANAYINSGTKPAYGELGIINFPRWARRLTLLRLAEDEDDNQ